MSVHSKVILAPPPVSYTNLSIIQRTMNNQSNNRSYNISIIQNISFVVASIKVVSIFLK